jgi:hypothetical protein
MHQFSHDKAYVLVKKYISEKCKNMFIRPAEMMMKLAQEIL